MAIGPVRGKSWGGPHGRLPVPQTGLAFAQKPARTKDVKKKPGAGLVGNDAS